MKKEIILLSLVLVVFSFILPLWSRVYARLGVGVTTGKIVVDERLMSGTIYNLPAFNVVNTGDEVSDYEVSVAYRENQDGMKPPLDWFTFTPQAFNLKPGESQTVDIELAIPIKTVPGDYFCFVEGHPVLNDDEGKTQIGISAASKLYFTIAPSNLLEGIYYRIISLWTKYLPWTNIGGAIVLAVVVLLIARKFIKVEVKLNKRNKRPIDNDKADEK